MGDKAFAKMSAGSLNEVADFFEVLGSDQLAAQRWQTTKKAKEILVMKASVYQDCADMLRKTTITGDPLKDAMIRAILLIDHSQVDDGAITNAWAALSSALKEAGGPVLDCEEACMVYRDILSKTSPSTDPAGIPCDPND